ncbi:PP0621 family protein [Bordetella petrii]|uniref:PP0621 family protein n=1 Tax=Bordetella petrii TaxID=94624 RepID=UPI001E47CA97|nr:PP0621 family protein [Bordetella petrii]MCD0501570.1 hypothetical protein [Bordetella petrii]
MGKLLLWVVIILVVMVAARIIGARASARRNAPQSQARHQGRPPASQQSESMVRCAHCGIHLPRSEAVLLQGQVWCSHEHARLGAK